VHTGVRVSWRAITAADAAGWCGLLAAAEAVDATGEHYAEADLLEELADPALDPQRDTVAAFDSGGRMIAYGLVRGATLDGGVFRVQAEGCVHPDHRCAGLGRETLAATVRLAAGLRRPRQPGELHVYAHDGNAGAAALLAGEGLRPARYWYDMRCDLTEAPPGPVSPGRLPAGLRLAGYEPALDEAVRSARNDAFAGCWGSAQRDRVSWRQHYTGTRAFRPELSFVALAGDDVAGLLLTSCYDADEAATGVREAWVGTVGTRPRWRRRGVASALLTAALAAYAQAGLRRAGLNVDSGNPSGALGLYRRCGFTVSQRWTTWARPL
jgi:mycothiol synthase